MINAKRKTNFLVILPRIEPGGAEITTLRVLKHISTKKNISIQILCLKGGMLKKSFNEISKLVIINLKELINKPIILIRELQKIYKSIKNSEIIMGVLYISQLLIALAWLLGGCKSKNKLIICVHNVDYKLKNIGWPSYISLLSFYILRFHKNVDYIFCSQSAYSAHKHFLSPQNRYSIINNGFKVDTLDIGRSKIRNKDSLIRILIVARYHPHKDYPNMLRALVKLRDLRQDFIVNIIGFETEQNVFRELESIVGKKKKEWNKIIKIIKPSLNIRDIYINNDILLLGSISEAYPNTIVEAYHYGLIVVATNVGEIPKMVHNKRFLCEKQNPYSISKKLNLAIELVRNDSKYKEELQEIYNHAEEKFSLNKMLYSYDLLIKNLLKS